MAVQFSNFKYKSKHQLQVSLEIKINFKLQFRLAIRSAKQSNVITFFNDHRKSQTYFYESEQTIGKMEYTLHIPT